MREKKGKQQRYKKPKRIKYFNIIDIAECWWEIDYSSEDSDIKDIINPYNCLLKNANFLIKKNND